MAGKMDKTQAVVFTSSYFKIYGLSSEFVWKLFCTAMYMAFLSLLFIDAFICIIKTVQVNTVSKKNIFTNLPLYRYLLPQKWKNLKQLIRFGGILKNVIFKPTDILEFKKDCKCCHISPGLLTHWQHKSMSRQKS